MPRLVPSQCAMRPARIQDLKQLALFDQRWEAELAPRKTARWRNFAALAFLTLSIVVALKNLVLLAWVLLAFTPLYFIFGWFQWLSRNPPKKDWANYWVMECEGTIQACAKWEHYEAYSEIQQVYVNPKWRLSGLATALIERCLEQTQQSIYIISDHNHSQFFERFGFEVIDWDTLPSNFPISEFDVPGLERPRDTQVPMVLQRQAVVVEEVPSRISGTRLKQLWTRIAAEFPDRPSER